MPKSPKKKTTKVVLPGYFRFTIEVFQLLWQRRGVFLRLIALGWIVSLLVVGISQQTQYQDLSDMSEVLSEHFAIGVSRAFIETGAVFISVLGGTLTSSLSESEQIYISVVYLFMWLLVVWLLRHQLGGTAVKLRDGLYNAGAPLLSTLAIVFVGLLQLLPLALGVALLSSLSASGVLGGGIAITLISVIVLLLGALSLYWLVSTFFAGIVVTIPGTYPFAALRSAKELIAGQRVRVLLRMVWLLFVVLVVFSLVVVPFIALDAVLNLSASFLIALIVQLVTITLFVYGVAYTYALYRRIIDERTE